MKLFKKKEPREPQYCVNCRYYIDEKCMKKPYTDGVTVIVNYWYCDSIRSYDELYCNNYLEK